MALTPAELTQILKGMVERRKAYRDRFSLENSGFSQLCRKAMEWLSDDTTHFHHSL